MIKNQLSPLLFGSKQPPPRNIRRCNSDHSAKKYQTKLTQDQIDSERMVEAEEYIQATEDGVYSDED